MVTCLRAPQLVRYVATSINTAGCSSPLCVWAWPTPSTSQVRGAWWRGCGVILYKGCAPISIIIIVKSYRLLLLVLLFSEIKLSWVEFKHTKNTHPHTTHTHTPHTHTHTHHTHTHTHTPHTHHAHTHPHTHTSTHTHTHHTHTHTTHTPHTHTHTHIHTHTHTHTHTPTHTPHTHPHTPTHSTRAWLLTTGEQDQVQLSQASLCVTTSSRTRSAWPRSEYKLYIYVP